jgi:hypothetical protein
MAKPGTITQREAIERVAAQIDGLIALDEFVAQVLAIWPSKAKNPAANVRQSIRDDHLGKDLLFQDETTLLPMRIAMSGVRFRIPLSRQEVNRGWLFVLPSFQLMFKQGLEPEDFSLEETDGNNIPVNLVTVRRKENTFFGVEEFEATAFDLGWWYKKCKIKRKDNLLVTILDWESGRFQIQPEPAREYAKHQAEIQDQNQFFADHLFAALETAHDEYIRDSVAIPKAYLSLKNRAAYPCDHWLDILEGDPRMRWTGYDIVYADWQDPFERMFAGEDQQIRVEPKSLSSAQAGQVYRFKAYFWHRKSLWRRIEIQGGQNLADFDRILREAFAHDQFDHLSGFWKLVRRGEGRRTREVDLGNINPYEGGGAEEIRIADLDLQPGEALKYVYDFGDWIEHKIELEVIGDSEPNVEYPRIVAQNKPRYQNCEVCQEQGRKSVGKWICITCSNEEQREILLCEEHLDAHDEDHYVEEMIY